MLLRNLRLLSLDITKTTAIYFYFSSSASSIELIESSYGIAFLENTDVKNVSPSGSFISKDGEYRSITLHWGNLKKYIEENEKIGKIYRYLQNYAEEFAIENEITLSTRIQFPNKILQEKYGEKIGSIAGSIKKEIFAISWFNFYFSFYFGFVSAHINPNYKTIMLSGEKKNIHFFKKLIKKFTIADIEKLRYVCNNIIDKNVQFYDKRKFGQKLIPLTIKETQNFFDISFAPWKEYFIGASLSNLLLNNVTNGFPMFYSIFLTKINKDIFDNPQQKEKFVAGEISSTISDLLIQAKKYSDITNLRQLSKNIGDNIDNLENTIISDIGLNVVTEYVGKTFYDSIFLGKTSKYYQNLVVPMFSKENYGNFRKYAFQICYNLLCLHKHVGIIHRDLHMNNLTLNASIYKKSMDNETLKKPKIAYKLNKQCYVFEQNFYNVCIIDFSRAIINISSYKNLYNPSIPGKYLKMESFSSFAESQCSELKKYYGEYFQKPLDCNFEKLFKFLSMLDIYGVFTKIYEFSEKTPAYKETREFLYSLVSLSRNYLEARDIKDQWPAEYIIENIFKEDRKDFENAERYDFDAPLKKTFPWVKIDKSTVSVIDYIEKRTHEQSSS